MVVGRPLAAEPGSLVRVSNPANNEVTQVLVQSDGSFSVDIMASANDILLIDSMDSFGNQGEQLTIAPNSSLGLRLNPIDNTVAIIGETTRFTVTANNSDGSPIELGLIPLPLPEGVIFNIVTGEFSFTPNIAQVGEFEFVFSAETATERTTETVMITVPALLENAPTVLKGRVLDANAMEEGMILPVVGMTIRFLDTNAVATTDEEGFFTLRDLPANAEVFDINGDTAEPGPNGVRYASFREKLDLIQHTINLVERPFFMPRLDADSFTQINPQQTTVVVNPNLDVSLEIPANTAFNEDGSLFTGEVSINLVPRDLAPENLPEFMDPGMLITLQPVGVSYSEPVKITFPNLDELEPGTEVNLWSVDPELGEFVIVGIGQVTADGQHIETISGGIRDNDWHAPFPPPPPPPETDDNGCNPEVDADCPPEPEEPEPNADDQADNDENEDDDNGRENTDCGGSLFCTNDGNMTTSFSITSLSLIRTNARYQFNLSF